MQRLILLAVAFYILQATEALGFVGRMLYGEWAGQPGNMVTGLSNLLLMAICATLFTMEVAGPRRIGTGALLAIGAALFLCASAAWSIDPQTTLRRGMIYLFVVLGAVGIAGRVEADEFMRLIVQICGFGAVASLVLLVVSPASAMVVDEETGSAALRGIFSQKNVLGQAMAVGALATLHHLRSADRRPWRDFLMLALFTSVTLLSKSATSLLIISAASGVDALAYLYRKGGAARLLGQVGTALAVPLVLFVVLFPDVLLELLGKDPTLTGRSELWVYVWADIDQKPWLGWGYAAFWMVTNPAAAMISEAVMWSVPQAHNGMLEILLNVGVAGLVLFVFLLGRAIVWSLRSLRAGAGDLAMSCLICCGTILMLGVSESVMMEPFQITTSYFFVLSLMCEKAARTARMRQFEPDEYTPADGLSVAGR